MKLNPVIRGWANYHRHVVSQQIFARIDHLIHSALWRWAKHKHPQKSAKWIKQQYFDDKDAQRYLFHSHTVNKAGKRVTIRLFQAAKLPIQRHIKIQSAANPYNPAWELYFEERHLRQTSSDYWDLPWFKHLWTREGGRCPVCKQLITRLSGWHNHHIQWLVYGGTDELDNRILLHPNCHRQVHSPDYNGPPLRPSMGV